MRRTKTRKRARRIHAFRRGQERYGMNFSKERERIAVEAIQNGRATFVNSGTKKATIWDVPYEDATMRVVYSKRAKSILTVLPLPEEEKKKDTRTEEERIFEENVIRLIRLNKAVFVYKDNEGHSFFDISYEGNKYRVLYDRKKDKLLSVEERFNPGKTLVRW